MRGGANGLQQHIQAHEADHGIASVSLYYFLLLVTTFYYCFTSTSSRRLKKVEES